MKIKYLDSVHCKADKEAIKAIKPFLEYESTFWKKNPFGKKRMVGKSYFVDGRSGLFLSGLLPKIKKIFKGYLDLQNKEIFEAQNQPHIPNETLRDYQIEAIKSAAKYQRGVIKAGTGMGKSFIAMGIMSCYPQANILYLCHSVSILKQFIADLKDHGIKSNFIRKQNKSLCKGINIATIQTFVKLNPEDYAAFFDLVLIDEAHHVNSESSQYGKILQSCLAPIKIGFTATLPQKKKQKLALEGLIGPVLQETTISKGVEMGIFVPPIVKLIPVPYQKSIGLLKDYQAIYREAIVESSARNNLIMREASKYVKQGKSVLIMIRDLDHGRNLIDLMCDRYPQMMEKTVFIEGATKSDERERVRKSLEKKKLKCVITTKIFQEGINIKSLNVIIYAGSGKSDIQVFQTIGRGTRPDKGKTEMIVVDFADRYNYLAQHAMERINIYLKEGWL